MGPRVAFLSNGKRERGNPFFAAPPAQQTWLVSLKAAGSLLARLLSPLAWQHSLGFHCAGKDTVLIQRDLLSTFVIQLQSIQANIIRIAPAGEKLELEDDWRRFRKEESRQGGASVLLSEGQKGVTPGAGPPIPSCLGACKALLGGREGFKVKQEQREPPLSKEGTETLLGPGSLSLSASFAQP